jgi:hypothetical protein
MNSGGYAMARPDYSRWAAEEFNFLPFDPENYLAVVSAFTSLGQKKSPVTK